MSALGEVRALTPAQRLERIEAVHQVHNLMGRYAFYHAANLHSRLLELHALETPGLRVELPFGIYEGRPGVERLYLGVFGPLDREPAGRMHVHTMTTPVVEVAQDGETAKGVWMSPGHATDKYGGAHFQARWRWVKYGCDFAREHGRWKIWHLRIYGIFATPFDQSWVEASRETRPEGPPPMPAEVAPDRPPHPFWQYSPGAVLPNEPAPPEPYLTFDDTTGY
jgi:hypothetical protein